MKKTYHICLSCDNETLCRDVEDFNYFFNSLALAVYDTDSSLLADSEMSNHAHECVRTEDPYKLFKMQRYRYTRYYNAKYERSGRLGERAPFIIEVSGLYHLLAVLSYIFRNALHHGIVSSPFAYPFSSVNTIFRDELGKGGMYPMLIEEQYHRHLPQHRNCPRGYKMDQSGLILREDVVDIADVEHIYGTVRTFLYYMNRLSGEEWEEEQKKDREQSSPIITLDTIERGVKYQTVEQMLGHEHGKSRYHKMTDLDLCTLIDGTIIPETGKCSVYQLSHTEKTRIAQWLIQKYHLSEAQIRRCLAMAYTR